MHVHDASYDHAQQQYIHAQGSWRAIYGRFTIHLMGKNQRVQQRAAQYTVRNLMFYLCGFQLGGGV